MLIAYTFSSNTLRLECYEPDASASDSNISGVSVEVLRVYFGLFSLPLLSSHIFVYLTFYSQSPNTSYDLHWFSYFPLSL